MSTRSPDLQRVKAFQTYGGNGDVYVAKLNTAGNAFVWATYLGSGNGDQAGRGSGCGRIAVGDGFHKFMLTAIDGQINGEGGVDKFRIQITGSGGVVYDNLPGGSDQANPTTELGAGVITIHP